MHVHYPLSTSFSISLQYCQKDRICVKIQIVRQKKKPLFTKDVKFHDDITQRNLGLMARLKNTEKFENVWFYNCNVYAKPEGKSKIRYDLKKESKLLNFFCY
jgi:hypothetical protein